MRDSVQLYSLCQRIWKKVINNKILVKRELVNKNFPIKGCVGDTWPINPYQRLCKKIWNVFVQLCGLNQRTQEN